MDSLYITCFILDSVCYFVPCDTRATRRAFGRLSAGLRFAVGQGYLFDRGRKGIYHLVLTSSDASPVEDLSRRFNAFVKRVRRLGGGGHEFEYFRMRTYEGKNRGVLHVVFKGDRLAVVWIRKQWIELYKAQQLRITRCYGSLFRLVRYLAGYLKHHEQFKFGCSKGWFWEGWRSDFRATFSLVNILRYGYPVVVRRWNNLIDRRSIGFKYVRGYQSLLAEVCSGLGNRKDDGSVSPLPSPSMNLKRLIKTNFQWEF